MEIQLLMSFNKIFAKYLFAKFIDVHIICLYSYYKLSVRIKVT